MTKVCKTCGCDKPVNDFPKGTGRLGVRAHCKVCSAAAMRAYVTPAMRRKYHTKHQYGLTQEQLSAMHTAANGACAICLLPCDSLHVDHCHTTLAVRGLLCHACNSGLGQFRDSPDNLRRAAEYLRAAEGRT